eukprot:scaffold5178_cov364-Prasinococcus_capsulatus_cf.AAC.3
MPASPTPSSSIRSANACPAAATTWAATCRPPCLGPPSPQAPYGARLGRCSSTRRGQRRRRLLCWSQRRRGRVHILSAVNAVPSPSTAIALGRPNVPVVASCWHVLAEGALRPSLPAAARVDYGYRQLQLTLAFAGPVVERHLAHHRRRVVALVTLLPRPKQSVQATTTAKRRQQQAAAYRSASRGSRASAALSISARASKLSALAVLVSIRSPSPTNVLGRDDGPLVTSDGDEPSEYGDGGVDACIR